MRLSATGTHTTTVTAAHQWARKTACDERRDGRLLPFRGRSVHEQPFNNKSVLIELVHQAHPRPRRRLNRRRPGRISVLLSRSILFDKFGFDSSNPQASLRAYRETLTGRARCI